MNLAILADEARDLGILIASDDEAVTIRPDGGETSEGDVTITNDGMLHEAGQTVPWSGTLTLYMAERAATNNWA